MDESDLTVLTRDVSMRAYGLCPSIIALCATVSLSALGCAVATKTCPRVEGDFLPTYTPLQPGCGSPPVAYAVPLVVGKMGVGTTTRTYLDKQVDTDVLVSGCDVRVIQTVSVVKDQHIESRLDGQALSVEGAGMVKGMVKVDSFDATGAATSCFYDATLTQMTATFAQ